MFLLYNFVITLLLPFWLPIVWLKSRKREEAPNWSERQGNFDLPKRERKRRVWLHAVSVGEVVAAKPILKELRSVLPKHEIILSVTTSSGHRTARESEKGLYDHLFYFPMDVARFQLAAMQRVRPDAVAIMETELWMNFLWAAKTFDARTLLINGRISDRSFPKSMKLRFFYRRLLEMMDRCLMQTQEDADRILALGAQSAEMFGNCKFDQASNEAGADPEQWRRDLAIPAEKPVLVIGSTRGEVEEKFVLDALQELGIGDLQVIHAPRHLERADALALEVSRRFGSVARRSKKESGAYLVLDSYGELSQVYSVADVVVVGGGFDVLGGQNILQPLAHGKPVIHGPNMQNFADVAKAAAAAGATSVASTPHELAESIRTLLNDAAARARMGLAASSLIQSNLGASRRYAEAIAEEARASEAKQAKRKAAN